MKYLFELFLAILLIFLFLPILIGISLIIYLDNGLPIIFRQERIGLKGKKFKIYKFRTFKNTNKKSIGLTKSNNCMITNSGKWLRKSKLDELPQLFNIVFGEMSFVGPRPELKKFLENINPEIKKIILSTKPGLTDPASIFYRNESDILSSKDDIENFYINNILNKKYKISADYILQRNFISDLIILFRTFYKLF